MLYLRKLYQYWLAFGMAIGVLVTPVQLFLVYSLVFGPARLVTAGLGKDLLGRRMKSARSFWHEKEHRPHTLDESRHQF